MALDETARCRDRWPRRRLRSAGPLAVVVAVAMVLAGCTAAEDVGSPAQRVTTWMTSGSGGATIGELEVDNRNVARALARHDSPAEVRAVCDLLATDAATGHGNLPTPDQQLTELLDRAYTHEFDAGVECEQAAGGGSAQQARSAANRAAGLALLEQAVRRVAAITGHDPSTTTTTLPPGSGSDPFAG
ncbi:MAG: hypothetical protein ACP5P9_00755 [Acidimicrobiales bacterium]